MIDDEENWASVPTHFKLKPLKDAVTAAQLRLNQSRNFMLQAMDKGSRSDFKSSLEHWTKTVTTYNKAVTKFLEEL